MPSPQFLGYQAAWTKPTTVYRMFSADGDLLYVGASLNPFVRFARHRCEKAWFAEVASVTFEHFENRVDALEAESHAILQEHPKYNVAKPTTDHLPSLQEMAA